MNTLRTITLTGLIALTTGCAMAPADPNRGELLTTDGVRQVFADNPDLEAIETTSRDSWIRCRHVYRVGTHLVQRLCTTVDEEKALADSTQKKLRKHIQDARRNNGYMQDGPRF